MMKREKCRLHVAETVRCYTVRCYVRYTVELFNLADACNCKRPCYNPVTEIEMIQQGEYLWMLDGSLTPIQKQEIKHQQLYTLKFNLKFK